MLEFLRQDWFDRFNYGTGIATTLRNANGTTKTTADADADATDHTTGTEKAAGNFSGNGTNQNRTKVTVDTNSSFSPAKYQTAVTRTQDYTLLKAIWEAQRKQADEMLKRIETTQNTATNKS